jgi:uncharacterized protein YbjT (DUF2867 family)
MKIALIAGCTGLIGNQLLNRLLESPRYGKVIAVARRPIPSHPKLTVVEADYNSLPDHATQLSANDVFCCLGTTIAKAKSKEKFYEVDHDYPKRLATISHSNGAQQFLLVSSLGADAHARIYYSRVKGEVEAAVSAIGYETVHIFRPSLLLGDREEQRSTEDAARLFYRALGFLIPRKYKAIDSDKVVAAMLHFASQEKSGNFIHESGELQQFS